jgi:hypothetical protein
MTDFRHPDLARPAVSRRQLSAIEAIILGSMPDDVQLVELEVLPAGTLTPNPAPLEVRATLKEPTGGSRNATWTQAVAKEIRDGWDRADFMITFAFVEDTEAAE